MTIVYFKTDTPGPVGLLCTRDERIDFAELGRMLKLVPMSIILNGLGCPKEGLKSESKWEQIKADFKEAGKPLGREEDPVLVFGKDAVPAVSTGLAGELLQAPQLLQPFVREVAKNFDDLLCEKNKFLRVEKDPLGNFDEPFLIWIRECYRDLKNVLLETLESKKVQFRRFAILGTAGVGKSTFTTFWVYYLATTRVKVVWKISRTTIYIMDFSREVATVSGPFSDFCNPAILSVVEDRSCCFILDSEQPYFLSFNCHVLLACSTKKSNYHKFLKHRLAQRLYLPVWAAEELDQFCDDFDQYRDSYGHMNVLVKKEVQANFEKLGGVPRFVLQSEKMEMGRDDFLTAVSGLSVKRCMKILTGQFVLSYSDKILHICVGKVEEKYDYTKSVFIFASSEAQTKIYEHLHKHEPIRLVQYLSDNWDQASFGPVIGGLYEDAALEILRRGGTFKRKRVFEDKPPTSDEYLSMCKLDPSSFDDWKELKERKLSTCYKPTSGNFDAVISPASSNGVPMLVQIFKRKKGNHGYKLQGLKEADDSLKLKKYELLSCLPKVYYHVTKFQTWRGPHGATYQKLNSDQKTLVSKMVQYVVEVDYKALLAPESKV